MGNNLKQQVSSFFLDKKDQKPAEVPMETKPNPHHHSWDLVSQTYAPPVRANIQVPTQGMSDQLLERALFGVTTTLWKCLNCSEIKSETMLGSTEQTLEELIAKTDEFGAQYINFEGKTFILMKVPPVSQTPGVLPVR